MSAHLQSTLHRTAPLAWDAITSSCPIGSIISFSLPYPFVELIPGIEATPSVSSSTVPGRSSPNQRQPHSCLVTGMGVGAGHIKVIGYMMGTMNGGTLLNKIIAKSATSSLMTSSGLATQLPGEDLFIPLHHPSTPGLQSPTSDSRPAFFPDPPLAPVYIPDVPTWLNLSSTTVHLSREHHVTQLLNNDGEPVQLPMPALYQIFRYIDHRVGGGGKGEAGQPIVDEADSDSESDDCDWDRQDYRIQSEEDIYWHIAFWAQMSTRPNFYTEALETLNIQRAQKAQADLDARAERVTQWLSHLEQEKAG